MSMGPPPPVSLPCLRAGDHPGRRRVGSDAGVQSTNDDAQISKLSCVRQGYFRDEFVHLFVRRPQRRSPLINRGYWTRYAAIRQLLHSFMQACHLAAGGSREGGGGAAAVCQVVSLGSGFDTCWFQLAHEGCPWLPGCHFMELDFPEVAGKKARTVLGHESMKSLLPPGTLPSTDDPCGGGCGSLPGGGAAEGQSRARRRGSLEEPRGRPAGGGASPAGAAAGGAAHVHELRGRRYSVAGADLRQLAHVEAALARCGFQHSLPTLFIAECVLIYMDASDAHALLAWTAGACAASGGAVVVFEQTRPDDAFGRTMVANLVERGCPLASVGAVPTPHAHRQRLLAAGWGAASAADMCALYDEQHRQLRWQSQGERRAQAVQRQEQEQQRSQQQPQTQPLQQQQQLSGGQQQAHRQEQERQPGQPGSSSCSTRAGAPGPAATAAAEPSSSASSSDDSSGWWLQPGEVLRIERLELLDEQEEWVMMQQHYCLALGVLERPGLQLAEALRLRALERLAPG